MNDEEFGRRSFVQRLSFFGGGAVLLGCERPTETPKSSAAKTPPDSMVSSHQHFTNDEFTLLTAVVDRMLPADHTPGGVAAGVPEYIDRILASEPLRNMKTNFLPGLKALDRRASSALQKTFLQASPAQQDEMIALFKNSPEKSGESRWYEMLVVLVLEGFLGDPSYGGNQNEVGWKLVGFSMVGRNVKGDPPDDYDGRQRLEALRCGGKKGC
jgi:gluconate 2-dehydrogenase gamma chain